MSSLDFSLSSESFSSNLLTFDGYGDAGIGVCVGSGVGAGAGIGFGSGVGSDSWNGVTERKLSVITTSLIIGRTIGSSWRHMAAVPMA